MPIYEYACQACGHALEAFQKISDAPLVDCPQCGQPTLKKKISAVSFRLKGSGWYETDFKTGDKKRNLVGDDTKPAESGKAETSDKGDKGDKSDKGDKQANKGGKGDKGETKAAAKPGDKPKTAVS